MGTTCTKAKKARNDKKAIILKHVSRGRTISVSERSQYEKIVKVNHCFKNLVYNSAFGSYNETRRSASFSEVSVIHTRYPSEMSPTLPPYEIACDSLPEHDEQNQSCEIGISALPSSTTINEISRKPYDFEIRNLLVNDKVNGPEVKGDLSLCKALVYRITCNILKIKTDDNLLNKQIDESGIEESYRENQC